jgi:hypothetical protein
MSPFAGEGVLHMLASHTRTLHHRLFLLNLAGHFAFCVWIIVVGYELHLEYVFGVSVCNDFYCFLSGIKNIVKG